MSTTKFTKEMSNIKESNTSDYDVTFENDELDDIYNLLNKKDRKDLFEYDSDGTFKAKYSKDKMKEILRDLNNPEIKDLYNNYLNSKERAFVDTVRLPDRIEKIKGLGGHNKYKLKGEIITEIKTPDSLTTEKEEEENVNINLQNVSDSPPPPDLLEKDIDLIPDAEEERDKTKTPLQLQFENIVKQYYQLSPYEFESSKNYELEVRFGTRGIKRLTKNDYDSVIKLLKSFGFITPNPNGENSLRIQNEFLNNISGKFEVSNVRTEIYGLEQIKMFCISNNIKELISKHPNSIKFTKKSVVFSDKKEKIRPVNFDDFNFRVSLQSEENMTSTKGTGAYIVNTWRSNKKTFRYLNRVTFSHPDYPVNVDISIIKSTEMFGNNLKTYYTTDEANVFNRPETYEIELEVDNRRVGPGTNFKNHNIILESIRKVIKYVLSGLQRTNFPISYPEQKLIIGEYMKLLFKDNYDPNKYVQTSNFIGPNSYTLQKINIMPINENSKMPNIRKNYTVTDKADGDRHLLYISNEGKIYLINTNMNVIFTGAKTDYTGSFNSLLDGELILHDKTGKFINLFAAFDIYYLNTKDVRSLSFMLLKEDEETGDITKSRYAILNRIIYNLNVMSILEPSQKVEKEPAKKSSFRTITDKMRKNVNSPIRISCKRFYPENVETGDIFAACDQIITKQKNGLFEYETDGLIFTPAFMGVGSDKIGESGPLYKTTWDYSFKWKPPKYNTIDFLVTTMKSKSNEDVVKNIFEDGTSAKSVVQVNQYKVIELRCTFVEKKHGYINPCQDIIDDKLPEFVNQDDKSSNEAKPMLFYPTNPYDPDAGICNIMLRKDGNDTLQMFTEENEVFQDNTIVEFSYDFNREKGWRWVPLRVRYDKTHELLQGIKNFGNAYHVANSNWQSIHNPITEEMICSGSNITDVAIDEDIYYNKPSGIMKTESLKNFHNLYVKKTLIKNVSKRDDTLIDFACGKAGDLPKWIASKLSFVFGIDISKDNLENRLDGACARYLNARKQNKHMPYALFVNGNSAFNIKNGAAMRDDKAIQITKAIFGMGTEKKELLGKGVARQYGVGADGFNISSCQFALHYFCKDPETLQGFLKNLTECTKLNGYFIGTAYDGKLIYKLLSKKEKGESIKIYDDDKKIWEIVKEYNNDKFEDNASSLGYRIDVYQESINQLISEYLINFDYFNRVMENYGFKIIDREEAQGLGFPEGSGLFEELYINMMEEIKKNKFKAADYGNAPNMNEFEKKISFLNRYFVYKKFRTVNPDKVELDIEDFTNEEPEYEKRIEVPKEKKEAAKIVKLDQKLLLVPSTEAIEEKPTHKLIEKVKRTKKAKPSAPASTKLIIEEGSDEEK